MYERLENLLKKPAAFGHDTTEALWNDDYISGQMLKYHLDPDAEPASRKAGFIAESIEWIRDYFQVNISFSICDFGCGPGLYANELARTPCTVTGIDFSVRSIAYAQAVADKEHLNATYINSNYLDYSSDARHDLITIIYLDFCVLSYEQRLQLLALSSAHLKPNGKLLFDVHSARHFASADESIHFMRHGEGGFWSPNPCYEFKCTWKYEDQQLILDKRSIIESEQIKEIFIWKQCYETASLKALLHDSGFKIVDLFADVRGRSYNNNADEYAVVAEKI